MVRYGVQCPEEGRVPCTLPIVKVTAAVGTHPAGILSD